MSNLTSAWNQLINWTFQPNEIQKLNGSFFYVINGGSGDNELDFRLLYKIYLKVPHLRAVIDMYCTLFSNGKLVVKNMNNEDEILYDHPLQKLLDQPNVFQSAREFMFMVAAYKCISADAFVYKNQTVGDKIRNLASLTPLDYESMHVELYPNVLPFEVTKKEELIKYIRFSFKQGQRTFSSSGLNDLNSLIHFHDQGIKFTDACSKIITYKEPITNIYKALKARGILIDKKGGIGALTGAQNKMAGGNDTNIAMGKKEKDAIYERLNKFGLGDFKESIIVTDTPLKWQPFVFPTKDLMLFEEIEDDFHQLCDGWGIRREMFEGQSNYSNKEHAERGTYQDTIIPAWEDFANKLNSGLNTEAERIKICVDYSHIAILQENEKEKEETQTVKSNRLIGELDKNLITREQYYEQMGYQGAPPPEKDPEPKPGNEDDPQPQNEDEGNEA